MANKVLSIEIGQGLTRVVEMDYKAKNPKIYHCFSFETPQNVVKDGLVRKNDTFSGLFKSACAKNDVKTKDAIFVVSSSRIASREAKLPLVKENRILPLVNSSASDYFPVDMSLFHIVYKVLETTNTKEEKTMRLNLYAVPNELTASYNELADSLGVSLVALDYVGNSVVNAVGPAVSSGINAIVKVEEQSSLITILNNGTVELQRTLNYGVEEAVSVICDNAQFDENLAYIDAVKMAMDQPLIRRSLNAYDAFDSDDSDEEAIDDDLKELQLQVTESLRYLVGNISRVIEFYLSRKEGASIDSIVLTGMGADFYGLSKLIGNELGIKCRVFQNVRNAIYAKGVEEDSIHINAYAACIGAGLNPMNLLAEDQVKKGGKKKARVSNEQQQFAMFTILGVVCVCVSVLLTAYSLFSYEAKVLEKKKLENRIEELRAEGVEEVYLQYTTVNDLNTQLTDIYNMTYSRNEDLVEFIEEMEMKMPSSLQVLNFTATSTGVTMTITCDTKEAAAKTLEELRTFESIDVVSSSGLTDTENLSGTEGANAEVDFTVDCVYKPVEIPTDESTATDASTEASTEAATTAAQ